MNSRLLNIAMVILGSVIFEGNLVDLTKASNPGLKLRISQNGLNYAASVVSRILPAKVSEERIPDQTGRCQTPVGKVDYEIKEITMKHFSVSSTEVTLNPDGSGLTWMLDNIEISIRGNWNYRYKRRFIRVSDHGSFDGSISRSSVAVSLVLGTDRSHPSDHPTIRSVGCESNIDHLQIQLDGGGASWLYNLILGQLDQPLRRHLQETVCREARRAVDVNVGSELAALQVVVPVGGQWLFDCGLVDPPLFQTGFIEFSHKGRFLHKDDLGSESSLKVESFQMEEVPEMVSIGISEHVLNSVGHSLYRHGFFKYNFRAQDLPPPDRGFLNTTCSKGTCFGRLVSGIGRLHPNAVVELEMEAFSQPQTEVSIKGIRSKVSFSTIFRARLSNESLVHLMKTNISATVGLSVSLRDYVLRGNLTGFVPQIVVLDSSIGLVSNSILQTVIRMASRLFIVPKLNEVLKEGVPLPRIKNIELVNHKIESQSHHLNIRTDVKYVV